MALTASFTYINLDIPGRVVQFTNHSSGGTGLTFSWDFGDGEVSTDVHPQHTYQADGFYTVVLTVTQGVSTATTTRYLGVSSTGLMLSRSIYDLVDMYIPSTLTLDTSEKQSLIQKWQMYLAILVEPNIAEADIFNEFAWPALVNQLIAELVAYDLIIQGANAYIASMSEGGSTTTGQQLKKVVTGPSEAEWFPNTATGEVWEQTMKAGGALDQIKNQVCMLSHRLRIYIPICKPLPYSPTVPEKHKVTQNVQAGNPFGLPDQY